MGKRKGLEVKTVMATEHDLVETTVESVPEQPATSKSTPLFYLNLILYSVTAAPRLLVVAGHVTATFKPEFVVVAAAN